MNAAGPASSLKGGAPADDFSGPREPCDDRASSQRPQATMTIFNSQQQNDRAIRWRGIAATVVVELLVLLALGVALVRYLEWSSAVNQAEFMSATEPSASVANHSGEFSTPVRALKVRADCDRKGLNY